MHVGIPKEIKNNEFRVAITPSGVHELVRNGHEVCIETGAGVGSSISDDDYVRAGAKILDTAADVWATGDLILKVKEPVPSEYPLMREGQTLFTFTAEPGSASEHALAFLASWAASPPETTQTATTGDPAGGSTAPARSHEQPGRHPGKTETSHD